MSYTDEQLKTIHAHIISRDKQLKQALAKMLPKKVFMNTNGGQMYNRLDAGFVPILDTELLHLCWLVEETLNEINSADYAELLRPITANYKLLYHATWQQRVEALAKVKGIEI